MQSSGSDRNHPFLTESRASEYLNTPVRRIREAYWRGDLAAYMLGTARRHYRVSDLERWARSTRSRPSVETRAHAETAARAITTQLGQERRG